MVGSMRHSAAAPPALPLRGVPSRMGWSAATCVALAWLVVAGYGLWSYAEGYYVNRGFPPPHDPPGVAAGQLETVSFPSRGLGQKRSYLIYLPPGYRSAAAGGVHFPVLYLLHAPPGRPDGYIQAGAVNVRADTLIARHAIRPMLIVLPYGKSGTFGNDTEWANARAGNYEGFVLDTVRAVDQRWSTRADRGSRAIGGLSTGAYGAINVALRHLRVFSVAESWSGYFTQTPTGPFSGATPSALRANSPSAYVDRLAPALRRLPLRTFLYQGRHDDVPLPALGSFAAQLRRAGAHVGTGVYPGGHSWALWRAQVPHMLRFADASFRAAGAR